MGNCLGSQVDDESHDAKPNFVNPTSSVLFTPGTSRGYSNGSRMPVSSSSADQSHVSSMASDLAILKGEILPTMNLKEYTFAELKRATKNFRPDSILGEGGFGRVFTGWVNERTLSPSGSSSGMKVAIKKLHEGSSQGYREWQSEVNFLGRLSHPNLVRLLGYCAEDQELLLVYAFVPNGSLENHLFRRKAGTEPLSWDVRLKIATGAARGLAFLHSSEKSIIYRDFKASNILLDGWDHGNQCNTVTGPLFVLILQDYNAKLGDFGLAKLGSAAYVPDRVMGTYGYAAPEYINTGHLYVKSDVYAFGVVLLELLTGLRALDTSRSSGHQRLVDWIKPKLSNKRRLKSVMDASLRGQYSSKAAHFAAQLTIRCLDIRPTSRPSMREVVEVLEQIQAIEEKAQQSRHGSSHSSSYRAGQSIENRHLTSHTRTGVVAQR